MNTLEFNADKPLKTWMSITGFRTLVILKSLMESGKTINELIEILKKSSITSKSVSKDTVRIAINTLKASGCEILRPSKANNFKYELIKHPFCLKVSDDDWNIFIKLRGRIAENCHWNDIFSLNDLYSKIVRLTNNPELIQKTFDTRALINVDKQVLLDIIKPELTGRKLNIKYLSPKFGLEDIDIIPDKITFENGNIYLWCFNLKYNNRSLLNVERIKKINSVSINNYDIPETYNYEVVYEIKDAAVNEFTKKDNEEIVEETANSIIIKADVDNEFLFIQRLLLFGSEFRIISPDFFKEKLIEKLKLIQNRYEE